MLEGKAVKLEGLAIFSAGIQTKKGGALSSEDFSTTKHIKSVYMRARATGEFTRQELTKAGNVTELPKNFTDYKEDEDESTEGGGSQSSGSQTGGGNTQGGTEGSDNSGSQTGDNTQGGSDTGGGNNQGGGGSTIPGEGD